MARGVQVRRASQAATPAVAAGAALPARMPNRWADHPRSRDIDSLAGDELRAYALSVGMSRRDCTELGEDRLRAGCKSHIAHHLDLI